jgi:hypothetical protein
MVTATINDVKDAEGRLTAEMNTFISNWKAEQLVSGAAWSESLRSKHTTFENNMEELQTEVKA